MLAKVKSYTLNGIEGYGVDVEVDINSGIPNVDMVGLPSTSTKESRERIRSAMKNSGFQYPIKRITVNLAPADTKKEGPTFDLPIAVAILAASEQLFSTNYKNYIMLGELSLDGKLREVCGVMPILISAYQNGAKKFIIPKDNAKEASYIEGIEVYAVDNLKEVADFLNGKLQLEAVPKTFYESVSKALKYDVDFADVKGQMTAKRALEIAVSGGHNVLMIGPPGAGKTMLARCVPTIMPDMTFEETIEVTKIHSIAGLLDRDVGILTARPFRTPHHTTTIPSLVGGGAKAKPGEVSLAHNGVLFLDEMPEYPRHALETLRQPLEDKRVTVSRVARTVEYPANFMLIASMNPCPCGNYGSKTAECRCTATQIHNYLGKLSGPLLDRIDIQIEVDNISYEEFSDKTHLEKSVDIKRRANETRRTQLNRFAGTGVTANAQMTNAQLKKFCALDDASEKLIERAFKKLNLSARATTRILKVARTIADMEGSENITAAHVAEAIQYRSLDRKYNDR
jgi:Mg chelatase-related protein